MIDPFEKSKTLWDNFDEMIIEKDDDLFDYAEESLEEMADNESDQGVVGIADWEDWN